MPSDNSTSNPSAASKLYSKPDLLKAVLPKILPHSYLQPISLIKQRLASFLAKAMKRTSRSCMLLLIPWISTVQDSWMHYDDFSKASDCQARLKRLTASCSSLLRDTFLVILTHLPMPILHTCSPIQSLCSTQINTAQN